MLALLNLAIDILLQSPFMLDELSTCLMFEPGWQQGGGVFGRLSQQPQQQQQQQQQQRQADTRQGGWGTGYRGALRLPICTNTSC